jgi:ribosomal protein S18 acetylase RimI-like enzyme
MQQAPEIRDGRNEDTGVIADVLTDAFSKDPVMNWVIPARQLYPNFFRLIIDQVFLPRGIVHLEQTHRGAALWLPPGEKFDVPPGLGIFGLMARLLLSKGPRPLLRIPQQAKLFDKHHPAEPHYHLLFVGCRQQHQGRGVGSALLKQGTSLCDERGMPAYLESSNELNVPLYRRHGFEVIAEEHLPGDGPKAWFMWREVR